MPRPVPHHLRVLAPIASTTLLVVLASFEAHAATLPLDWPDGCGHGRVQDRGTSGLRGNGNTHIAVDDTVRALVVFARFPDGDDGVACDPQGWPNGTVVPAWADSLLEDNEPPVNVGTLTHFMALMSHGKHVVLGTYYPSVVVLDSTIVHYDTTYPSGSDADAVLHANLAVTLKVVAQWDTLLTEFDRNGDGFLDHLHIVYRSTKSTAGAQYNLMETFNAISWHAPYYSADTTLVLSNGATIKIDDETGSCQRPINAGGFRRTRRATFDTFKHEYMHDVVETYGLPLNLSGVGHIKSMGPYGIMDGTYIGEGQFIDGFTLAELGWIDPLEIDATSGGGDTTIVLSAAPDPAGYAIVKTHDPKQYFVLELRNKVLPYALGEGIPGCLNPAGFTGLLVTHIFRDGRHGWGFPEPPLFDPEVATGMFANDGAPDPIAGADMIQASEESWWTANTNDLYKPFNVDAFAPWSNPSSNLYVPNGALYSKLQTVHSGITLSDIAWVGPGFGSIRVRVRFEGIVPPVAADTIRVDTTWQGLVQLTGDLVVGPGATVTAASTAKVISRALHDRHAGGLDPTRTEVTVLGGFHVTGTPTMRPLITSSRDDSFVHYNGPGEDLPALPGDWRGLRVPGGEASWSRTDLRYATTGIAAVSADSVAVDDCTISGFADTGILFTNSAAKARYNLIVGADSVSQRGIALLADSETCYATLLGNTVYSARTGISFTGLLGTADAPTGTTAIDSNLVAQLALPWEWQGIALDGATRRDALVVRSNDIGPASDVGLLLRRCRSVVVSDCNRIEGARVGIFSDSSERSCGVTGNLVLNSTNYGIRVRGTGPTGQIIAPIFGDVTSASYPGRNNIHGSGLYDAVVTTGVPGTVLAQNNWWGTAPPQPSQFLGAVSYTPWGFAEFPCDTAVTRLLTRDDALAPERAAGETSLDVGASWPNPFGGQEVYWSIRAPAEGDVTASLYDVRGRRVRRLAVSSGGEQIRWDGKNDVGHPVGAGVYFLRVESPGATETRKVIRTR